MFANSFSSSARSSSRSKFTLRTRFLRLASPKSRGIHHLTNFRIPRSLTRTRLIVWCVDESRTTRTRAERNGSSLTKLIIAPESSLGGLPGLTRSSIEKLPALNFRHQFANINRDGMSLENSTKFGVNCLIFFPVHKEKLHHVSLFSSIHSDTVNVR
jgi:hypothetical protein